MSQLGGFDFVFQFRRDKLLDLIKENVTVQGKPLLTPFRLSLLGATPDKTKAGSSQLNSVDLLVKSLGLTLEPGTNFCNLILQLDGGVIRLPDAPEAKFFGGAVNIRIELLDRTFIIARLLEATLEAPANPAIAGIPNFTARANQEVNKLIDAERNKLIDIYPDAGFVKIIFLASVSRNLDGETFCIANGPGNLADVTPTVTANNSVTYGVSAAATTKLLPTAEELSRHPVTITRLDYEFRHDFINVTGEFEGEDTCWSIDDGTFTQRFIPLLVSQTILITPEPQRPEISCTVDVGFLCQLGMLVITLLNEIIDPMALIYGPTWLKTLGVKTGFDAPKTDDRTQPALAVDRVTWSQLVVSPEGFLLLGDLIGVGLVSPVQHPAIHIRTNDVPQNLHAVAQGTATVQAPTCAAETFDYVESIQDDQNTLTVESDWLFEPIELAWTINGNPLKKPEEKPGVGDPMSELVFTGTVTMALPPPNGTAIPGHGIKLRYQIVDRTLLLSARNEDSNYDIRVEVRATDALGRVFTDAVNLTMVGDIAEFGTDYDDYLDACLKATDDLVNKKGRKQGRTKPGEPQESWRELVDAITQQIVEGNAEAQALIPGLTKTLGSAVVSKALVGKTLAGKARG